MKLRHSLLAVTVIATAGLGPLVACSGDDTGTAGTSAVAPPIMGLFGDRFGVPSTIGGIALGVLLTIPLAIFLNPILARVQAR